MRIEILKNERSELVAKHEQELKEFDSFIALQERLQFGASKIENSGETRVRRGKGKRKMTQGFMVQQAIVQLGEKFTKTDAFKKTAELFPTSNLSQQDVSSVLWRMAADGNRLKVETKGHGKTPSIYAKVA